MQKGNSLRPKKKFKTAHIIVGRLHRRWSELFYEQDGRRILRLKQHTLPQQHQKQEHPTREHKPVYESCRQWFMTEGDVDDFIFYHSEEQVSQR